MADETPAKAETAPGPTVLNPQAPPTEPQAPPQLKEGETPPKEPTAESSTPKSLINEEDKTGSKDQNPLLGAPEKYADFTAPEGFEIDAKAIEVALPVFKEIGVSQEGAQRLINIYADLSKQAAQAPIDFFQAKQAEWISEIKADPEIGSKLDTVRTTVSRMLDGLGDPKLAASFREAMDYTGAGNNPAFIRVLYRVATKLTEGGPVTGSPRGSTSNRPESAAKALYPNNP